MRIKKLAFQQKLAPNPPYCNSLMRWLISLRIRLCLWCFAWFFVLGGSASLKGQPAVRLCDYAVVVPIRILQKIFLIIGIQNHNCLRKRRKQVAICRWRHRYCVVTIARSSLHA
ncbi:hypothetical protein JB92DRAFT_1958956 [Gautieria morchelliformis]|nr:hypothetical protein JB92DRAFT_1958956 [Gautieria morchelliformis]